MYQFNSVATGAIVGVDQGTESVAHPEAQSYVGISTSIQQFFHCLAKEMRKVQDRVRFSTYVNG